MEQPFACGRAKWNSRLHVAGLSGTAVCIKAHISDSNYGLSEPQESYG